MRWTTSVLHRDESLVVVDVECRCPAGLHEEEEVQQFEVIVPLSGAFLRRSSGGETLADAAYGYVAVPGSSHEIEHLTEGDRCVALAPAPEVAEAVGLAAATGSPTIPFDGAHQRQVAAALAAPAADDLVNGETWLHLLTDLASPPPVRGVSPRARTARQAAVRRVREAIVADPGASWTVPALAEVAGYSPHHLSRVFRAETGMTLSRYRDRIRLGTAIAMLRGGAMVADVAAGLGYCDQAHLARRAAQLLGLAPSALSTR